MARTKQQNKNFIMAIATKGDKISVKDFTDNGYNQGDFMNFCSRPTPTDKQIQQLVEGYNNFYNETLTITA